MNLEKQLDFLRKYNCVAQINIYDSSRSYRPEGEIGNVGIWNKKRLLILFLIQSDYTLKYKEHLKKLQYKEYVIDLNDENYIEQILGLVLYNITKEN